MPNLVCRAVVIALGLIGPAMAQERVLISSDWGRVTAELIDNAATRALVRMLPLTIQMRDHLRQEKTGNLPSPLPQIERQLDFSTRSGFGVQITSSSTTAMTASLSPASSCSAG